MELLRTESVTKFKLGPIDLVLSAGEILGVTGPAGAGKTTLLRLAWGFLQPDRGSVSVFRLQPHLNQMLVRQCVGYLRETPVFNGCMSTRQHMQFVSQFYERWNPATADSLLDRFRIDPHVCVQSLSDGAKTKLALISATAHDPNLLLLDNPLSGLDAAARSDVITFLRNLAERGVGILLSSRQPGDIKDLANSLLMLDSRDVHACGSPDHNPSSLSRTSPGPQCNPTRNPTFIPTIIRGSVRAASSGINVRNDQGAGGNARKKCRAHHTESPARE